MKAENSITICNIRILSYETELIFVDNLQDFHRTHTAATCAPATRARPSQCAAGSAAADKGALIFVDLRDRTGILQLTFDDETDRQVFEKAKGLRSEYVVAATGRLKERRPRPTRTPTGGRGAVRH